MKRKSFLKIFLGALGADNITWGNIEADKIYGTAIYDETNLEEQQDFVWYMSEENVPSEDVKKLIKYLSDNYLIEGDKITTSVEDLDLIFSNKVEMNKAIEDLFKIEVKMIDNGKETDIYFLHN